MLDRDFANRFLAFYRFGYKNYTPDLDTFMSKAMADVKKMTESESEKEVMLFINIAMNDVQLIVETHSDHIVNGIRVAVKEKDISNDRLMLFYFERKMEENEQYSKITNIEVDSRGELSSYPTNLLDEWSNQLVKLV